MRWLFLLVAGMLLWSAPWCYAAPADAVAVIPFEVHDNCIFLKASVGRSKASTFLLDTGASHSILTRRAAVEMGIPILRETEQRAGIGENTTKVGFAGPTMLSVGTASVTVPDIPVLPLDLIEALFGRQVDGILGAEFFQKYVVALDYRAATATLYDPASYSYQGTGEKLSVQFNNRKPVVSARIASRDKEPIGGIFLIDTGDNSSLTLNTPFVRKHGLRELAPKGLDAANVGVGGEAATYLSRVETLWLGGAAITRPLAAYSAAAQGSTADASMAGSIGGEVLRRFRVIFDYAHSQMILEAGPTLHDVFERDMSGVALKREGPDFKRLELYKVFVGTPAAEAGLRVGDVVEEVGGKATNSMSLEEIREELKVEGKKIDFTIRRGEMQLHVTLTTRRLV